VRAAEDAAVDALQPAVIYILAGKEAADLMAVQPGRVQKELGGMASSISLAFLLFVYS